MSKPTHKILLVSHDDKKGDSRQYSQVGVGWVLGQPGEGQTISLTLNPGVVLDWRIHERFYINVKPIEDGR
jgi:hypothetical protein